MTVLFVREVWEGRGGSLDTTTPLKPKREYTRTFIVGTDSPLDDAVIVGNAVALVCPPFSAYVGPGGTIDLLARCSKITPRNNGEHPSFWNVTVDYSTRAPGDDSRSQQNPTERPAVATWSGQDFQKPIRKDAVGNPIVSSAGDPLENVEIDDSRMILTYTRNEPTYDPAQALLYNNVMNSDVFLGFFPQYTAKCGFIGGELQYESGFYYYKKTYVFHFRVETWFRELLDEGFRQLDSSMPSKPVPITDLGHPVASPVPLDGSGKRLVHGSDLVYKSWAVYHSLPFAPLNISLF